MENDIVTIDYCYRPESYWTVFEPAKEALQNAKGSLMRRIIEAACRKSTYNQFEVLSKQKNITRAELVAWAENCTDFLGEPNLPHYLPGEVEIARISFPTSVLNDIICIWARKLGGRIKYRIVDDNGSWRDIKYSPKESKQPLTLQELIALIDGASYSDEYRGLGMMFIKQNYQEGDELDDVLDMVHFSSKYYEQLSAHYQQVIRQWYKNITQ